MQWKRFDRVRREVGPVHLDLVESYAAGKISRRDFVRRGTMLGLTAPMIGTVIAALGRDEDPSRGRALGAIPVRKSAGQQGGTIRVAYQAPAGPVDPVQMQDLSNYGLIAQCFEFLITLGEDGELTPCLAESWEPNEDGTIWTFQLRQGVTWQADGSPFTSADVAATMDRLVEAGNAALQGVIAAGAVDASDPNVAVFNLESANGNLPALVSVFNAQGAITPVSYEIGTTLDASPNGTGPWKLTSFDTATGASFERNADWWGGQTPLDGQEVQFFSDLGTMVTAIQGGAADAIVQFSVIGGDALFGSPDFTVLEIEATTHREVWMGCSEGQFVEKAARQALALTFDREQMVNTLFQGRGVVANDHIIAPFMPFFNDSVPQRTRDIDAARAALAEAGYPDGLRAVLHAVDLQEIPELAQLIQAGAAEAGIELEIAVESGDTFYGSQWCPADGDPPCAGAAELGIVDYGHRPFPDVFLNAAFATGGVWNSSQYSNPDFDAAFKEYQSSLGVEAQTVAAGKLETILNEDVPAGIPYFYNYLSGHSTSFQGIRVSALGQMFVEKASQV
jgi:peptide/nickel transport system substrate-binding protein